MKRKERVGIDFNKSACKWRARIKVNKKEIHLGYFLRKEDAVKARERAEYTYSRTPKDKSYIRDGLGYIALTNGKYATVDLEDYHELDNHNWVALWNKDTKSFYATRKQRSCESDNPKPLKMHRVIMSASKSDVVDHIKHNTLDNRKSQLRIVSTSQNGMNKNIAKNNTTGSTGVYDCGSRWRALICVSGVSHHLGYFDSKMEAIKARREAEQEYFGEYSYSNSMHCMG